MSNFLITVELREVADDEPGSIYDRLHKALIENGVTNVVRGGDGSRYLLPSATYVYEAESTAAEIRDWVNDIVSNIHPDFSTLITKYTSQAWKLRKTK